MAEWSNYLKQAVANVEQRLDQVLLESKEVSLPKRSESPADNVRSTPDTEAKPANEAKSRRPDLSERMKKVVSAQGQSSAATTPQVESPEPGDVPNSDAANEAVNDSKTTEPTEPTGAPGMRASDEIEPSKDNVAVQSRTATPVLETFKSDFATAPDLQPTLKASRDLALALTSDSTHSDAALDLAEMLEKVNRSQTDFISHIGDRFASLHSKIQVLSEPHFGGADKLEEKVALLMDEGRRLSEQELKLSTYVRKLRAGMRDNEKKSEQAVQKTQELERKLVLLTAERDVLSSEKRELEALVEHYRTQAEPYSNKSESTTDQARLESLEAAHAAIRASWQERELELLQRAAELEASADNSSEAYRQVNSKLSDRLKEAQIEARKSQEQVTVLQEELDSQRAKIAQLEEALAANDRNVLPESREGTAVPQDAAPQYDVHQETLDSCAVSPTAEIYEPPVLEDGPSSISLLGEDDEIINCDTTEAEDRFIDLGPTESPFDTTRQSSLASLTMDVPDRDSLFDGHSADMSQNGQMHVVARLSKTVRKLQSELSATRKSAELATRQREEAQGELVKLLDIQDELELGKTERDDMEKELKAVTEKLRVAESRANERSERIAELEADVADLKLMYREQVEALIQEIARLSGSEA